MGIRFLNSPKKEGGEGGIYFFPMKREGLVKKREEGGALRKKGVSFYHFFILTYIHPFYCYLFVYMFCSVTLFLPVFLVLLRTDLQMFKGLICRYMSNFLKTKVIQKAAVST